MRLESTVKVHEAVADQTEQRGREIRFKTILLATGGAIDADAALTAAADLAQRSGAELHLVTAFDLPAAALYGYPAPRGSAIDANPFKAAAFAQLEAAQKKAKKLGAAVAGIHAESGEIFDVVVHMSEVLHADLIVVGSRELGGFKRMLAGSVSASVVRNSHCPVLIVRGAERAWPPAQVIVGFDHTRASMRAARMAATIVHLYPEITMTLIQVLPDTVVKPNPLLRNAKSISLEHQRLNSQAEDLAPVAERTPATTMAVGNPAGALIAHGRRQPHPTLTVIGTRGLGSLKRLVLGSVSNKILHSGHGPLLIIPESADPDFD